MKALIDDNQKRGDTMFWRKVGTIIKGEKNKSLKNIEGKLLGYMVSRYGLALDEIRNLSCVEREVVLGDKPLEIIMIRIFNLDIAKERGINIDGYGSLDRHPELILYEGYYRDVDDEAMDINLKKK
ncbi:MAG: hypothetical protein JXA17_06740 [Dehalococcoidales bacterium]|nr:hypothetical protein [Dehalococcoidales bacterium]